MRRSLMHNEGVCQNNSFGTPFPILHPSAKDWTTTRMKEESPIVRLQFLPHETTVSSR